MTRRTFSRIGLLGSDSLHFAECCKHVVSARFPSREQFDGESLAGVQQTPSMGGRSTRYVGVGSFPGRVESRWPGVLGATNDGRSDGGGCETIGGYGTIGGTARAGVVFGWRRNSLAVSLSVCASVPPAFSFLLHLSAVLPSFPPPSPSPDVCVCVCVSVGGGANLCLVW